MGNRLYFILRSRKRQYIVVVNKNKQKDATDIYIGNHEQLESPYVHIEVKSTDMYLRSFAYDPKCGEIKSVCKFGTAHMLRCAIDFCIRMFNNCITRFELQDNISYYENNNHNKHVIVSARHLLLYGKTWYQEHLYPLKLKPTDVDDRKLVKKYKKKMLSYVPGVVRQQTWQEYLTAKKQNRCLYLYSNEMEPIIRNVFKLPSLYGVTWGCKIPKDIVLESDLIINKIEKPADMKVKWNEHTMKHPQHEIARLGNL